MTAAGDGQPAGLFDVDETPPGMVRYTERDLKYLWALPAPDDGKPLSLTTCHDHRADAAESGYVEKFTYDYGFGTCGVCHPPS